MRRELLRKYNEKCVDEWIRCVKKAQGDDSSVELVLDTEVGGFVKFDNTEVMNTAWVDLRAIDGRKKELGIRGMRKYWSVDYPIMRTNIRYDEKRDDFESKDELCDDIFMYSPAASFAGRFRDTGLEVVNMRKVVAEMAKKAGIEASEQRDSYNEEETKAIFDTIEKECGMQIAKNRYFLSDNGDVMHIINKKDASGEETSRIEFLSGEEMREYEEKNSVGGLYVVPVMFD